MVALLAEGVDRNYLQERPKPTAATSPSSRRAWIEIIIYQRHQRYILVALLAEGVDRNPSRSVRWT